MIALLRGLEWFTKLVYLNFLWLIFTILGLGLLGFFPAMAATFSVVHQWIHKNTDIAIFREFWRAYKLYFFKSNLLGFVLGSIGVVLLIDLFVLNSSQNVVLHYLSIPLAVLIFLYSLMLFYIIPSLIYFEQLSMLKIIKNAFFTMVINPLPTFVMLVGTFGFGYLVFHFQALIPILSMSLFALIVMMPARRAFETVQRKKEQWANGNQKKSGVHPHFDTSNE